VVNYGVHLFSVELVKFVCPFFTGRTEEGGRLIINVNCMAFYAIAGKTKEMQLPVTPSTVLSEGAILTFTSGKLVAAGAATTAANTVGILKKAILSSDSDYASDRLVSVLVPIEPHVVFEADVTSGLVATDVGGEFDLTSSTHVNRAASAVDVVKCVGVISSTKGLFFVKLNGSY
jgi:hypothetical protein